MRTAVESSWKLPLVGERDAIGAGERRVCRKRVEIQHAECNRLRLLHGEERRPRRAIRGQSQHGADVWMRFKPNALGPRIAEALGEDRIDVLPKGLDGVDPKPGLDVAGDLNLGEPERAAQRSGERFEQVARERSIELPE